MITVPMTLDLKCGTKIETENYFLISLTSLLTRTEGFRMARQYTKITLLETKN
jgi:hypothetical protein